MIDPYAEVRAQIRLGCLKSAELILDKMREDFREAACRRDMTKFRRLSEVYHQSVAASIAPLERALRALPPAPIMVSRLQHEQ